MLRTTTQLIHSISRRLFRSPQRRALRPVALRCEQMEDRALPATTVSIVALSDGTTAGTPAVFEVDRTGDTSSYLTVDILMSGTADFYTMSQVGIPAGDSSAELDAVPVSGGAAGTVDVTLEDSPGAYDVASPGGTAEVNIFDSTAATFTLGGSDGSLRYDIPWAGVDPDQASQSLALANFAVTIGYGMGSQATLTPATATFTASPTIQFACGVITGITFAVDTSSVPGFPYSTVSASGTTISAVETGTGTTDTAPIVPTAPPPALIVTTEKDVVDPSDGLFSLREAINEVNRNGPWDGTQQRITFAANLAGKTISLNGQLPLIQRDTSVFIDGQGQVIEREDTKPHFRLLQVEAGATLQIAHLGLNGGWVDQDTGGGDGGAIFSQGNLAVTDCTFLDDRTEALLGRGGAICAEGNISPDGVPTGSLAISGCTFDCNSAYFGGAVYVGMAVLRVDNPVTISGSSFDGNSAWQNGGAICLETDPSVCGVEGATATISNCTITSNTAGDSGGGIYSSNVELVLTGATAINTNGASEGGGVAVIGVVNQDILYGSITYAGVSIGGNSADTGDGVYRKTAGDHHGTGDVTFSGNSETYEP